MSEPVRPHNPLGDPMPPEGSPQRRKIQERADKMLAELQEFGRRVLYPLFTRPTLDHARALLCLDCEAIFEADAAPGDDDTTRRNECPRCTSGTNVRVRFQPLEADPDELERRRLQRVDDVATLVKVASHGLRPGDVRVREAVRRMAAHEGMDDPFPPPQGSAA